MFSKCVCSVLFPKSICWQRISDLACWLKQNWVQSWYFSWVSKMFPGPKLLSDFDHQPACRLLAKQKMFWSILYMHNLPPKTFWELHIICIQNGEIGVALCVYFGDIFCLVWILHTNLLALCDRILDVMQYSLTSKKPHTHHSIHSFVYVVLCACNK